MNVNKCTLAGRLGSDPEVKYTPSGAAIASISLATNEVWNDKQTNQKQEKTHWHRVQFFGKTAELIVEHFKKGMEIYVEGSINQESWEDKETGKKRYATSIKARTFQFVGGKGDSSKAVQSAPQSQQGAVPSAEFEDDIPFLPLQSYP